MKTYRLIGSAQTLERLKALIELQWGWISVSLEPLNEKQTEFSVASGNGLHSGLRVVKKGKRYRFEQESYL